MAKKGMKRPDPADAQKKGQKRRALIEKYENNNSNDKK